MSRSDAAAPTDWRTLVFKNRGLLLVPVALILIVFGKPTLTSAIAGTAVAALGEILRIWAVGFSGVTTRADFVTAPALVTAGPYAYVRNPLYVANAVIALGFWGAFSGAASPGTALAMLGAVVVLVVGVYAAIIPLEEGYLRRTFGASYEEYLKRVPRIAPTRPPLPGQQRHGTWRGGVIVRAESITLAFFVLVAAAVWLKLPR